MGRRRCFSCRQRPTSTPSGNFPVLHRSCVVCLTRGRLLVLNLRGTGLSDRPANLTLESRAEDINAVLDAAGLGRVPIFGVEVSANVCALFAATYPERCERLALFEPYATVIRSEASPEGLTREQADEWIRTWRKTWGEREQLEELARNILGPKLAGEPGILDWWTRDLRLSASPSAAAEYARMANDTDITTVLGAIRVSTLVLHRERGAGRARYVADRIPNATVASLGGEGQWAVCRRCGRCGALVPARRSRSLGARLDPGNGALH